MGSIKEEDKLIAKGVNKYPSVSIIVPCWNEEQTVSKTIHSLLNLDYPKNKLKIIVVDDGSTDNTWEIIQKFRNNPQVEIYSKENGGKYTALNFGLAKTTSELFGCLDSDSYVHKDALKHIITYFQNKEIMAVAPSVKLWQPKGVLQLFQKVEYGFGIFTRKMFHYMQAVYITPGPFSIFRREVFDKLGGYRHAHNTEDIEIALRMQKNHMKIAHAHSAMVYTVAPKTIKTLLKQRIRWSHGFIKNAFDYRTLFLKREYGNLGLVILPMASISIVSVISVASISVFNIVNAIISEYLKIKTIGFNFNLSNFSFDWFYIDTELVVIIGIIAFVGTATMVLTSRKMSEGKLRLGMDLIYFFVLYMFIAPIWITKAAYNAIFSVKTSWR
ncbi:MAG: glycosyltransferase family 2 protein [Candidatus Zambryskibacteria bacterium]|nr:glycosyltransferase family 2 protein [Candidatus Zambryskibacteria bacterium]